VRTTSTTAAASDEALLKAIADADRAALRTLYRLPRQTGRLLGLRPPSRDARGSSEASVHRDGGGVSLLL
jgi:hypothetical protein